MSVSPAAGTIIGHLTGRVISERSAVWVPYVVRRAERTFRKPVVPAGYRCHRRSSAAALLGLVLATSGAVARTAVLAAATA
jgi:hypothetical protein